MSYYAKRWGTLRAVVLGFCDMFLTSLLTVYDSITSSYPSRIARLLFTNNAGAPPAPLRK